jgi:hypothetical protein
MEGVKAEKIIEILQLHNVHISLEQARLILDFMFKFANIALSNIK